MPKAVEKEFGAPSAKTAHAERSAIVYIRGFSTLLLFLLFSLINWVQPYVYQSSYPCYTARILLNQAAKPPYLSGSRWSNSICLRLVSSQKVNEVQNWNASTWQLSQPMTATSTSKYHTISVGDVRYDIDVSKIPYLLSFVDFQANAQPQSIELVHDPIPLFDTALKGIGSGYRQCFRSLPADLSQHRILCDTYDFLRVDVLGGQSINEISRDLKPGQSDYDREERREIKGDKSKKGARHSF